MDLNQLADDCQKCASRVHCTATRIYNIIREVGRGELTADNALHQLVEDYHDLSILGETIGSVAENLFEYSDAPDKKHKGGK